MDRSIAVRLVPPGRYRLERHCRGAHQGHWKWLPYARGARYQIGRIDPGRYCHCQMCHWQMARLRSQHCCVHPLQKRRDCRQDLRCQQRPCRRSLLFHWQNHHSQPQAEDCFQAPAEHRQPNRDWTSATTGWLASVAASSPAIGFGEYPVWVSEPFLIPFGVNWYDFCLFFISALLAFAQILKPSSGTIWHSIC